MNYIVEPMYEDAEAFSSGMAVVKNNDGLYGYIDTTGKEVIPCQFDLAGDFGEYDLAWVEVDGKCGFIRKDGSYYIEPCFDSIGSFTDGYAVVAMKKGQKVKICK